MKRRFLIKLSILAGAVITALLLTQYRPVPQGLIPFGIGQAEVRAAPSHQAKRHDLSALKVVRATLRHVHDDYVDPKRIHPREMLLGALDSVQRNVAEVMIEPSAKKDKVTVRVNDKHQTFDISKVVTIYSMFGKMKTIFGFIHASKNSSSDSARIEYAATNGLLSTLDPHSVLLDPEQAKEMEISTSGKFGGIGIHIMMLGKLRNKLTVMRLIGDKVPAAVAGLKAGDHIIKIDGHPTANLTLHDAMMRLRGLPKRPVVVTVTRKKVAKNLEIKIIRDQISVPSVRAEFLSKNVGYLKLSSFQSQTANEMRTAMRSLRRRGARAWVLDMRWNPGGLLDQAVEVADLFLDSGTIVTTVSNHGQARSERRASARTTESRAPLVVLVNGNSASASEIVAGALKHLNRAAIIGRTTFGKGSVQILYNYEDKSKLKITIAQYLTPGDVSIQGIGISPDIELIPLRARKQRKAEPNTVLLRGVTYNPREADLSAHLTSKNARKQAKPYATVRYFYTRPKSAIEGDDDDGELAEPPIGDDWIEDQEIKFARDFVASVRKTRRSDMLAHSKSFLKKRQAFESARLTKALVSLGIDWSHSASSGTPHLSATFKTDKPGNKISAGDVITITGTVKNSGNAPAQRVLGWFKSDDYLFDEVEMPFGRIEAGTTRMFQTRIKVPLGAPTRVDKLTFEFKNAKKIKTSSATLRLAIQGRKRPTFAYAYQIVDSKANGDGLVQRGEKLEIHVTIKNIGVGTAKRVIATLNNSSIDDDNVIVNTGRFDFKDLAPGKSHTVVFEFDVTKQFRGKELVFELSAADTDLGARLREKVRFPIRSPAAGPRKIAGFAKVRSKRSAQIHEGAADNSAVIARSGRGSVFAVTGRHQGWTRVEIDGRPGFVRTNDLVPTRSAARKKKYETVWQVTPPTIAVKVPSVEVSGNRWRLQGAAMDDNHIDDVFVLVSNRDAKINIKKVFYRSNRKGRNKARLDFTTDIPVWPGNNMITVVARESNEVQGVKTFFINRTDKPTMAKAKSRERSH